MKKMNGFVKSAGMVGLALLIALGFFGFPASSAGGDFPERNITFIVPYSPGGGFDLVSRITAPFIEKHLPKKTNVIVKNVPGAGTRIGTMEILRSEPDGYTIGVCEAVNLGFGLMALAQELKGIKPEEVSWLLRADLLPVALIVSKKSNLGGPSQMKGRETRFGVVDASITFKTGLVAEALGTKYTIIRYDGASQINIALMQGDTDCYLSNWASAKRTVNASEGKIEAMFMAAPERIPEWNEVPTARELGVELDEALLEYNHYIFAPPRLDPEVEKVWEETMNRVLNDEEWKAKMDKAGYPPRGSAGAKLKAEVAHIYKTMEHKKDFAAKLGIK